MVFLSNNNPLVFLKASFAFHLQYCRGFYRSSSKTPYVNGCCENKR